MRTRHDEAPGPHAIGRGHNPLIADFARTRRRPSRWDVWLRLNTRWQGRDDDDDPPPCPACARPRGPAPLDADAAALVAA